MSDAQEKTTGNVLQHHLESFGAGDVDALMEDYTSESIVMTQTDTLVGLDAIRKFLTGLTTSVLPVGCKFEMEKSTVEGEVAFISWKAESETHKFHLGTDTFVIKDGKIAVQTLAAHMDEK